MFELHPSVNNHVFKQDGRIVGQGAEETGPVAVVEVVRTPADVDVVIAVDVVSTASDVTVDELTIEVLVTRRVEVDEVVTTEVDPALV